MAASLNNLRVVLVNTRNPLNIGASARAMSNFGFSKLRVVKPFEDAWREARSAVGAAILLQTAEEYSSVGDAIADCRLIVGTTAAQNRTPQQPLRDLREGARMIRRQLASGRVAILFGSEKRGLSNQDFSHCHWLMRIPTRDDHGSMNLGQAVAVCLYELARGRGKIQSALRTAEAESGEVERISELLTELLVISGYAKSSASTSEKNRRLIRRLRIPADDASTWMGILRQLQWKMKNRS